MAEGIAGWRLKTIVREGDFMKDCKRIKEHKNVGKCMR